MADVAEDQLSHRITQLSIFLPNRLGALLSVTRLFDTHRVAIRALSIVDAADHSVARIVVDRPTLADSMLRRDGYSLVETELLGVVLGDGQTVRDVLKGLLMAELNVHYVYALIGHGKRTALALHVEDPDSGARVLTEHGFRLLTQDDIA